LKEIHASQLARYYWCAEECRIRYLENFEPTDSRSKQIGKELHDRLHSLTPLSHQETLNKIWSLATEEGHDGQPCFKKEYRGWKILGTPDWFLIDKKGGMVQICEDKTWSFWKYREFLQYPAQFQLKTYCFILKPLLKSIKLKLAKKHFIFVWKQASELLTNVYEVIFDEEVYLRQLNIILDTIEGKRLPIPPRMENTWKCNSCPPIVKEKCIIHQRRSIHKPRLQRTRGLFTQALKKGMIWEKELKEILEKAGHVFRETSRDYVSHKLGGISGLDLACVKCGQWFDAKLRKGDKLSLNPPREHYNLKHAWVCLKNDEGIFYIPSTEVYEKWFRGEEKSHPLRSQTYVSWPLTIFKKKRIKPPPCEGESFDLYIWGERY